MERDRGEFSMSFYVFRLYHPSIPSTPPSPPPPPNPPPFALSMTPYSLPLSQCLGSPPFLCFFSHRSDSPHFVSFLFSFWYFSAEGWQNILSIILCHRVLLQPRYGMKWYVGKLLAFWWYKTNSLKLPLSPLVLNLTPSLSHTLSCLFFTSSSRSSSSHLSLSADGCSCDQCFWWFSDGAFWLRGFLDDLIKQIMKLDKQNLRGYSIQGVCGIEIELGSGLNACILWLISLCAYVCVSPCDSKCLSVCSSYGAD